MRIRFDKGPDGSPVQFAGARELFIASTPAEVSQAFDAMENARNRGLWLVGYATYELGYALEPKIAHLMPDNRKLPLLCFGAFEGPHEASPLSRADANLDNLTPRWDAERYAEAFGRLHEWIGSGDIYQVNLTFPIDAGVRGTSEALYAKLMDAQPVGHGALIQQEDGPDILSRSPELFFRISDRGAFQTLPMKGTMPRGTTPEEDARNRTFLTGDEKNRAENLMIVDLLRNDLSRIAEIGSVRVPELFHVDTYATVHQMVSRVTGQLRENITIADIFRALYPCGSITGAPKIRAMEIIRILEDGARNIYCGSIGWIAPTGAAEFNVAIRTILRQGDQAILNVGGGVVWDSTAASEYEEALWKARFAKI